MKILHPVRSGKAAEPQVMGGSSSGNGLAIQYLCPRGDKLAQTVGEPTFYGDFSQSRNYGCPVFFSCFPICECFSFYFFCLGFLKCLVRELNQNQPIKKHAEMCLLGLNDAAYCRHNCRPGNTETLF